MTERLGPYMTIERIPARVVAARVLARHWHERHQRDRLSEDACRGHERTRVSDDRGLKRVTCLDCGSSWLEVEL